MIGRRRSVAAPLVVPVPPTLRRQSQSASRLRVVQRALAVTQAQHPSFVGAASGGPPAYVDAVLADAPLAYYRLQGDATDSSGNGHDGTLIGAPATVTGPLPEGSQGMNGFTDTNHVKISDDVSLDMGASCVIEFLYNLPSKTVNNSAFTIGDPGPTDPRRCQAHITYAGTIYWDAGDYTVPGLGGNRAQCAFDDSWVGNWVHIALTMNQAGSGLPSNAIYINGVDIAGYNHYDHGSAVLTGGFIGLWPFGSGVAATDASMAEFAIYDESLTDSRIMAHAVAGGFA